MKKYRKKPIVVEAIRWDGILLEGGLYPITFFKEHGVNWRYSGQQNLVIETLEGEMRVYPGNYIIKGIKGEFYSVEQDIFSESYEEADSSRDERNE